jgi:hypothetical protein
MGFLQDPVSGAWYKEGTTPDWLIKNRGGVVPAKDKEEAPPSPRAEEAVAEEEAVVEEAVAEAEAEAAEAEVAAADAALAAAAEAVAVEDAAVEEAVAEEAVAEEAVAEEAAAEEAAADSSPDYDFKKNFDHDQDGVISVEEFLAVFDPYIEHLYNKYVDMSDKEPDKDQLSEDAYEEAAKAHWEAYGQAKADVGEATSLKQVFVEGGYDSDGKQFGGFHSQGDRLNYEQFHELLQGIPEHYLDAFNAACAFYQAQRDVDQP